MALSASDMAVPAFLPSPPLPSSLPLYRAHVLLLATMTKLVVHLIHCQLPRTYLQCTRPSQPGTYVARIVNNVRCFLCISWPIFPLCEFLFCAWFINAPGLFGRESSQKAGIDQECRSHPAHMHEAPRQLDMMPGRTIYTMVLLWDTKLLEDSNESSTMTSSMRQAPAAGI